MKYYRLFPIWLLWVSLVVITFREGYHFVRFMMNSQIINGVVLLLFLWYFPFRCMLHVIRNTEFRTMYKKSHVRIILWLTLIFSTLFQTYTLILTFTTALSLNLLGLTEGIIILLIALFILVIIPSYCIWNVIRNL